MRKQIEEKLAFYAGRIKETRTNDEWVEEAIESYKTAVKNETGGTGLKRKNADDDMTDTKKEKKKDKKNKKKREDDEMEDSIEKMENLDINDDEDEDKKKKKKKDKKKNKD